MVYTQIPSDILSHIQLNAGILLSDFTPSTASYDNDDILAATSGGLQFSDSVTYKDFGEDIDNCPKNTKELKVLENHEIKLSGTLVTANSDLVQKLIGAADSSGSGPFTITPRNYLSQNDFFDLWWVGDYSSVNTGNGAGFIAIKISDALSTGGFKLQSTDKEKGKFAFEFTAHYSISNPDTVPYTVYVKEGETSFNAPTT